ncbi:MAG TPA: hypothetical protein VGR08_11580, partial [Thermomicrobiales bacterium]|nr:hypothetical protein [Thermomicrobiales bacterium]
MLDRFNVESVNARWVVAKHRLQPPLGVLRRCPWRNDAQPERDAVDMGIDGKRGHSEAEQQNASGSLRADSVEGCQPCHCLGQVEVREEREIVSTAMLMNGFKDGLDSGRLAVRQPTD